MNIEHYIITGIKNSLEALNLAAPDMFLERPKQEEHGDYSSNVAMLLTPVARKAPRMIAEEIVHRLQFDADLIEKVEIAGPGFINFHLGWGYYRRMVREIIDRGADYGRSDWGGGIKVMVEFISANPTGPLNVVSARAAAVGDVLVNLFNAVGYQGYREYYINDAGRQVRLLGMSVSSHYMKSFDIEEPFPEEGYHGEYVREIAEQIAHEHGDQYSRLPQEQRHAALSQLALEQMIVAQQHIIDEYGVHFDCWFRESQLREAKAHQRVLEQFEGSGLSYRKEGAIWFKSEAFGDEKDRVLVTSEGEPTYFLIDIAYHLNKYERGFEILYDLWGPDHHGYIPRMKAALKALGHPESSFDVAIIQQVNLLRSGEVIKMSKRAGRIIEMREVLDEVGVDVARFFFIHRKISSHLDFDLDLAVKQSDENPVFYLQYAHARICSILSFAKEKGIDVSKVPDLNRLEHPEERDLIKSLTQYPGTITAAAKSLEPNLVTSYLQQVATIFHRFYHVHQVVSEDESLTLARIALVNATRIVLANGFNILGISAPEKM